MCACAGGGTGLAARHPSLRHRQAALRAMEPGIEASPMDGLVGQCESAACVRDGAGVGTRVRGAGAGGHWLGASRVW